MSGKIEFLAFYELLGVRPDCNPETLKNAYRHRVAALHPDRRRDGSDPRSMDLLQELNVTYAAAMRFYRTHGRLPGTIAHARVQPSAPRAPAPRAATPRPRARVSRKAVVFALIGVGILAWLVATDDTSNSAPSATMIGNGVSAQSPLSSHDVPHLPLVNDHSSRTRAGSADASHTHIEVGMDEDSVRAIEGPPFMTNGEHWDYGPSWIEFEHGHVSDWYSSPLRRLRVGSPRPPIKPNE
ncbi:MAG TPA: J domain-containing protein [Rhodanobacteraceae bacterium]|nr:J domain-containing protein [Rhodanobacteraceae bacterium]